MSNATDTLETALGEHLLRSSTFAKPAALYIGIFQTLAADDGTGGIEPSGANYARVQCGPGDAYWTEHSTIKGRFYNAQNVQFPVVGAGGWGSCNGIGYFTAPNGGTPLIVKPFSTGAQTFNEGDTPIFTPGQLTLTFA